MVLFSVAIIFVGLGWHSLASSSSDKPEDAAAQVSSSTSSTSAPGIPATTSSSPSSVTPPAAGLPQVCVLNAGSISGLANDYNARLKNLGYRVGVPGNLETSSITENTLFYRSNQRAAAATLATDLGGGVSLDVRPSSFTQCPNGLALVVVTR